MRCDGKGPWTSQMEGKTFGLQGIELSLYGFNQLRLRSDIKSWNRALDEYQCGLFIWADPMPAERLGCGTLA